jgi:hypothetical protein
MTMFVRLRAEAIWRSTASASTATSGQIRRVGQAGVDGQEIVGPEGLDPVAGIVEEPGRLGPRLAQGPAELADRPGERRPVRIGEERRAEAARLQRLGHQPRVVHRVLERNHRLIAGISDHQRDAGLGQGRRDEGEERKHRARAIASSRSSAAPCAALQPSKTANSILRFRSLFSGVSFGATG